MNELYQLFGTIALDMGGYSSQLDAATEQGQAAGDKIAAGFSGMSDKIGEMSANAAENIGKIGVAESEISNKPINTEGLTGVGTAAEEATAKTKELGASVGTSMEEAGVAAEGAAEKIDLTAKASDDAKAASGGFMSSLKGFAEFAGIMWLGEKLTELGPEMMNDTNAAKTFDNTLSAMNWGKDDIEATKKNIEDLTTQTGYSFGSLSTLAEKIAATGAGKDQVNGVTDAVSKLTYASGGTEDAFNKISKTVLTVDESGKVTSGTFSQLAKSMPAGAALIQQGFEKQYGSADAFRQALSKGQITAADFNSMLEKVGSSKSIDNIVTSGGNAQQQMNKLKEAAVDAGSNIISSFSSAGSKTGNLSTTLATLVTNIGSSISSIIQAIAPVTIIVLNATSKFLEFISANKAVIPVVLGIVAAYAGFQTIGTIIEAGKAAMLGFTAAQTGAKLAADAGKLSQLAFNAANMAGTIASKAAAAAQWLFNAAMDANPITLVVIAIAALVAGLVYFFTQTKTGREIWAAFVKDITNIWNGFVAWIKPILSDIGKFFSDVWKGIQDAVKAVFDFISNDIIKPAVLLWKDIIEPAMKAIGTVFSDAWDVIKDIFVGVITAIAVILGTIYHAIVDPIVAVFDFLKPYIQAGWDFISGIFNTVTGVIKGIVNTVWSWISGFIQNEINGWETIISTVWNTISGVFNTVLNTIKGVVSTVWNAISSTTSSVWNTISGAISSVWNGIKSTVSGVVNAVESVISGVWNSIKSTTSSIWNGILTAIQTPLNTAKSFVSGIIDAIKGFFNFKISWPQIPMPHFGINPKGWNIGDLLKGKIPSLAVDWYAQGGIMDTPTVFGMNGDNLAVGGEAGPEAILPLDKNYLSKIGDEIVKSTPSLQTQNQQQPINVTQNIYSHDSLTPTEIATKTRQQFQQIRKYV